MINQKVDLDPNHLVSNLTRTSSNKPVVVGIYGIPGSGKTFLLNHLKSSLGEGFELFEGSEVIASLFDGDLDAFQKLDEPEKAYWRQRAIDKIGQHGADTGRVTVITGHFMFWNQDQDTAQVVCTPKDLQVFTHIIYLDVAAETVAQRRIQDIKRKRAFASPEHLTRWQQIEKTQLRALCSSHSILFSLMSSGPMLLPKISLLLHDFQLHTEEYNLCCAQSKMDEFLALGKDQLETVLVMDADKTLAAEDAGAMFWELLTNRQSLQDDADPLKTLFSSSLGHSYAALRQATLLYEEAAEDAEFDALCEKVASRVTIYPEFASILQQVAQHGHIGAVIVTCGLRQAWERVLEKSGLSNTVKVIGGGRIADGFVVTPAVKTNLVARLRNINKIYVWAFGDSPLDMGMLQLADQAIVVVGEEEKRSKSMDKALLHAINNNGLAARQALMPPNALPRLNTTQLPLVKLTDRNFLESVFVRRNGRHAGIQILHAGQRPAAKLLMTPMRNAALAGRDLRRAHYAAGWYLAVEFLTQMIGVEDYSILHVQGHLAIGYRLFHEQHTSIIALMRGGEAMALGVSAAFPLAMFVHASSPGDVGLHHLQGQISVVLVDSVVNSGKTVVQFAQRIRDLHATIRIILVAGVVQAQSLASDSPLQALASCGNLSLVALRLSDNMFTGRGTTDTGNRLFNTTHLP